LLKLSAVLWIYIHFIADHGKYNSYETEKQLRSTSLSITKLFFLRCVAYKSKTYSFTTTTEQRNTTNDFNTCTLRFVRNNMILNRMFTTRNCMFQNQNFKWILLAINFRSLSKSHAFKGHDFDSFRLQKQQSKYHDPRRNPENRHKKYWVR
jgi:hypothetical protein